MRIYIALLMLLLAGCAMPPKPTTAPPPTANASQLWERHQQKLRAAPHWLAEGRLAASQGQKGGNASFVWQQQGDSYLIKLFGPFGAGAIYITGHPSFVELKEANDKITRAQSPELLLQKIAGWTVPVQGLRYWLRGLPLPHEHPSQLLFDNEGRLNYLQQQGWKIEYENYQPNALAPLPSKLRLQRHDIKIKMIVTSWQNLAP